MPTHTDDVPRAQPQESQLSFDELMRLIPDNASYAAASQTTSETHHDTDDAPYASMWRILGFTQGTQAMQDSTYRKCPHFDRIQRRFLSIKKGLYATFGATEGADSDGNTGPGGAMHHATYKNATDDTDTKKHYKLQHSSKRHLNDAAMHESHGPLSAAMHVDCSRWSKEPQYASSDFSYKSTTTTTMDVTTSSDTSIHPRSVFFQPVNQTQYFPPMDRSQFFHSVERCRESGEMILVDQCMPLLKEIRLQNEAGCRMLKRGIIFRACNAFQPYQAYYSSGGHQIVLCCNHINGEGELISALKHELIHAFDACRFHNSLRLCRSRACSEVRAYHMDRSCENIWSTEYNSYDDCIRSLAMESIQEACPDTAEEDVSKVFESCIKDFAPFSESEAFDPRTLGSDELHEVSSSARTYVDEEFL